MFTLSLHSSFGTVHGPASQLSRSAGFISVQEPIGLQVTFNILFRTKIRAIGYLLVAGVFQYIRSPGHLHIDTIPMVQLSIHVDNQGYLHKSEMESEARVQRQRMYLCIDWLSSVSSTF